MSDTIPTPKAIATAFEAVHSTNPLVQCITNTVIPQFTANVLLAIGASPAMCDNHEEADTFASFTDGLLINVGTPHSAQVLAMKSAVEVAAAKETPWVLDPVAVGPLKYRTTLAQRLLDDMPTAIRGNASEVQALFGSGAGGKGVDSTASVDSALNAARGLAGFTHGVVAVSGQKDVITSADPDRTTTIMSGHPLMQLVVGTGCALGAISAAYLGAVRKVCPEISDHDAVAAAHAHAGAAGILAARTANGPGSFHVGFIDSLYSLSAEQILNLCEIE